MKKNIVLFVLFVLPIVAYLFFASGINSFAKLPVVTEKVSDLGNWQDLSGNRLSLDGKITILGFGGHDLISQRGNIFNLNQKIYQRYHKFADLQFVILSPIGTEGDAKYILEQIRPITDISNWHFVFAQPSEITALYNSLKINRKLDADLASQNVFIIDKERSLRGRKGDSKFEAGYSMFHPSELSNEMLDDFKIVLYEYRAALKKNNNATRKI